MQQVGATISVFVLMLPILFWLIGFLLLANSGHGQIDHPAFRVIGTDSVETYASGRYRSHSFLHHWLMGRNYRQEWQQWVRLPVLRLSATDLKIEELGGGMQTKSLKLEDSKGREWALRSVDKDVAGALPDFLEGTIAGKATQDHISASFPYGAPVVGALARAIGIIAAQPVVYFVADDPALGAYRSIFANTVCMLEERNPKFSDTEPTDEVLEAIQSKASHLINQPLLLKARLLDMLVADWDRHSKNWRWGERDSAGLRYYYAVPRDRDWAFYQSGGLVPKLIRIIAMRHFINFGPKLKYVKSLSAKAHLFDAVFLNSMGSDEWRMAIRQVQKALTDSAIEAAVRKMPVAVYEQRGHSFVQKLKSRRDDLEKKVMPYYRFLSRQVQIEGSSNDELFSLQPASGGLRLQIFRLTREGARAGMIYNRLFSDGETFDLTLNGLGGADRFEIAEDLQSSIHLELNGGDGNDSYQLGGRVRTRVHDKKEENNLVWNKNGATVRFR